MTGILEKLGGWGFLKWWYPTTMGFPTKKWLFWGYSGVIEDGVGGEISHQPLIHNDSPEVRTRTATKSSSSAIFKAEDTSGWNFPKIFCQAFPLNKKEVTPWFQFNKNLGVKVKVTDNSAQSEEVFSGKIDIVTLANWKLRYVFGSFRSYHGIPYLQQSWK